MADLIINFDNQQDKVEIEENSIIGYCEKMLDNLVKLPEITEKSVFNGYNMSNTSVELDIMVCNNAAIREINLQYRNKDKETDVITFALFADDTESRIITDNTIHLGEIIISAEKTSSQASENNRSFEEEFLFLLAHGMLHALGFDHKDESSLEFMLDIQDKITNAVRREKIS